MARPEEITEKIRQLATISGEVFRYLEPEHMTVRMVVADTHNLIKKKDDLLNEIKNLEEVKIKKGEEHNNILALAKEEADKILSQAREQLYQAQVKNQKAGLALAEAEKARYIAEKDMNRVLENKVTA